MDKISSFAASDIRDTFIDKLFDEIRSIVHVNTVRDCLNFDSTFDSVAERIKEDAANIFHEILKEHHIKNINPKG